jgi:hypothetical protein
VRFKQCAARSFKVSSTWFVNPYHATKQRSIDMIVKKPLRSARATFLTLAAWLSIASTALAQNFIPIAANPAGNHGGIEYVEHFGLFAGTTAKGDFVMPYQIYAPANPSQGNGVLLFEPPHFVYGPAIGRDATLGRELLFSNGFAHASVGFSELLLNILAPIPGLVIAGGPAELCDPVSMPGCTAVRDIEILKQFNNALASDSYAISILGPLSARYAFGSSQSAETLLELIYGPGIEGLFDFTILYLTLWQPKFPTFPTGAPEPGVIPEDFVPADGIGRVILVNAEGDQLISDAQELRSAVGHPDYRLYEVAGAPHLSSNYLPPAPGIEFLNPLDAASVARAAFVAGHRWVAEDLVPPPDVLLAPAPPGQSDPIYEDPSFCGGETGIARDANGNALGGVKLPDVAAGRGTYIACTSSPTALGLPLLGLFVDRACEPAPGAVGDRARFRNHGAYVSAVARQAGLLVQQGYLLAEDADRMVDIAGESQIGKPDSCD